MKVLVRSCVVLLLSTSLAAQTTGTRSTRQGTKRRSAAAVTAEDLNALRELLQEQQRQIQELAETVRRVDDARRQSEEQLRQALAAADQARSQAGAASTAATEQEESVTQLKSDVAEIKNTVSKTAVATQEGQKKLSALEGLVGRFRLSGDVRVRYENFYQDGVQDRHRERIRLRLGVQGKINEDFNGGIFIASGTLANGNPTMTDPVSTNETLTSFFERKAVGFDRGWITYNPQAHKWLSLTGGKFAYTWDRTIMSFDNDLNPEGFSQKLSFKTNAPVFKNVTFNGMQLMFNEVSGGIDSFAVGGGASTRMELGPLIITPSYSILNWRNADVIAQAAGPATPLVGSAAARVINANPLTNATRNCGAVATPHPECRLGGSAHREFVSRFLYSDFILDTNIKTPWARWPVRLLGEFLRNLNAENEDPLAVGKQDSAYWFEASIGRQREKNDVQIGYSFGHVEQDALIGQFADSDFRAQTNVIQHRVYGQWRIKSNVTAAYTLFVGRTLNCRLQNAALASGFTCATVPPFNTEPLLKRMQFDLSYAF